MKQHAAARPGPTVGRETADSLSRKDLSHA
jgi:hypothetical protein